MIKLICVLTSLLLSVKALSAENLMGEFQFGGPIESNGSISIGNSHIHFVIVGESAKKIFESLDVKAYESQCIGENIKSLGNVLCIEITPGETYECGFALNLHKNKSEASKIGAC